jgi:hypothetical protein
MNPAAWSLAISRLIASRLSAQNDEVVASLVQLVGTHLDYARSAPWAPLAYPMVSMRICLG